MVKPGWSKSAGKTIIGSRFAVTLSNVKIFFFSPSIFKNALNSFRPNASNTQQAPNVIT
jgi:hypothetical protein